MGEVKNVWRNRVNAPSRNSCKLLGTAYKMKRWVECSQKGNREVSERNKYFLCVYVYGAFPYYGFFPKAGSFSDLRASQI